MDFGIVEPISQRGTEVNTTKELVIGVLEVGNIEIEATLEHECRWTKPATEDELFAGLSGVGGQTRQWSVEKTGARVGTAAVDNIRNQVKVVHDDMAVRLQSSHYELLERFL